MDVNQGQWLVGGQKFNAGSRCGTCHVSDLEHNALFTFSVSSVKDEGLIGGIQ